MRLLFVCRANICRSPMAEGVCKRMIEGGVFPGGWKTASAGTWTEEGGVIHPEARRLLSDYGVDLSDHRSREINEDLLADADLVLTMERTQVEAIRVEFSDHTGRVHMLSELVGEQTDVEDPVMNEDVTFRETFDLIRSYLDVREDAVLSLVDRDTFDPRRDTDKTSGDR